MNERVKWGIAGALLLFAIVILLRAMFGGPDVDELAASDDDKDRLRAVLILQERESDAPELLGRLAGDPVPHVAMQAVTAMGRHRTVDHRKKLRELIETVRDPEVRGAAAAALGHYENTSVSELQALMREGEHPDVRAGAAKGLARKAKHDRRSTIPALLTALRDHDPGVRIWAITGIYNVSGHQFPGYDAAKDPREMVHVIQFIENKLREKGLY